jgi:hypothetical protein
MNRCIGDRRRYDIQTNECNGADDGSSLIYDPVDLRNFEEKEPYDPDETDTVFTMVDVDYYADMAYWLDHMRPMLLYSMAPVSASSQDNCSSSFTFENDHLAFQSHGGYCTRHAIWNYGADYCRSIYAGRVSWYRVIRYALPASRVVIALAPVVQMPERYSWMSWMAPRHDLCRHVFTHKGEGNSWTAFRFWTSKGLMVSVAASGPDSCAVTVPWDKFSEVIDTMRVLGGARVPEHTVHEICGPRAFLLCKYAADYIKFQHRLDNIHRGIDTVTSAPDLDSHGPCPCPNCVDPKQRGPNDSVHLKCGEHDSVKEKDTVTLAAPSCMVDKVGATAVAVAPIRDKGAAKEASQGRVLKPQADAAARVKPAMVRPYVEAFIRCLMLRLRKVDPYNEEQVLARVKPSVRDATAAGFAERLTDAAKRTQAFIKAETYPERKSPRLITPLNAALQARMYKYAYALQDALHEETWFAFGTSLPSLAKRIADKSRDAYCVIETDYSKYDGTITRMAREIERKVYEAYFPGHRAELAELAKWQQHVKVSVKGVHYDSGFSRSSGAPDTCLMNSILNLFSLFLCIGTDAFSSAVVGGDDGVIFVPESKKKLIVDGDCPALRAASASVGFDIKCSVKRRTDTFSFLARRFSFGCPHSICQPDRLLPKLHILAHPNIPAKFLKARYRMKLDSLMLSDANTPVVGDVLRREISKLPDTKGVKIPDEYTRDDAWWAAIRLEGPWPNEAQPWMAHDVARYVRENGGKVECVHQPKASP